MAFAFSECSAFFSFVHAARWVEAEELPALVPWHLAGSCEQQLPLTSKPPPVLYRLVLTVFVHSSAPGIQSRSLFLSRVCSYSALCLTSWYIRSRLRPPDLSLVTISRSVRRASGVGIEPPWWPVPSASHTRSFPLSARSTSLQAVFERHLQH
jgi:hypothetical protein